MAIFIRKIVQNSQNWQFYLVEPSKKYFSFKYLQLTSDVFPGTVFFISAGFSLLTLVLATYILISLKGKKMSEATAMGAGRIEAAKAVEVYDTYYLSKI